MTKNINENYDKRALVMYRLISSPLVRSPDQTLDTRRGGCL